MIIGKRGIYFIFIAVFLISLLFLRLTNAVIYVGDAAYQYSGFGGEATSPTSAPLPEPTPGEEPIRPSIPPSEEPRKTKITYERT